MGEVLRRDAWCVRRRSFVGMDDDGKKRTNPGSRCCDVVDGGEVSLWLPYRSMAWCVRRHSFVGNGKKRPNPPGE